MSLLLEFGDGFRQFPALARQLGAEQRNPFHSALDLTRQRAFIHIRPTFRERQ